MGSGRNFGLFIDMLIQFYKLCIPVVKLMEGVNTVVCHLHL